MAQRKSAAVSMDYELSEEALVRARSLSLTFSAYVVQLIRKDLQNRGSIVIQETASNQMSAPPPRKTVTYSATKPKSKS